MLRLFGMILLFCLANVVTAQDSFTPSAADSEEFESLFNGHDLSGWDGDSRLWSVKDGVIHGETTKEMPTKGNTFLILQDKRVKDFELQFSFRLNATNNSGVQYRSQLVAPKDGANNAWVVRGYQHELRNENTLPNVSGFIYDERGKRGRICLVGEKAEWNANGKQVHDGNLIDQEGFAELMKVDDWNEATIIAKGNHIQHFLNGKLILDFTDNAPEQGFTEGVIALQLHGGKPMWTEFKDLRFRELAAE